METSHNPASFAPLESNAEASLNHRRISIGDLVFDCGTGEVWSPGQVEPQRMRPRVAKLLTHLAQRPGQLCSRLELQQVLWGDRAVDAEQGLNACVRDIRRRLGDNASSPAILETLPGRGYRLIAPVIPAPGAVREQRSGPKRKFALISLLALMVIAMALVRSAWAPPSLDPVDSEARDLMREADYLAKSGDPGALQRSIGLMEKALDLEPTWALAHAELAQAHWMVGDVVRAKSLAALALALDPDLAEANAAVGFFAFYDDLDWVEAERRLERAVELDPASSAARHAFAHVLSVQGQHGRATRHMQVAVEIDPVDARLRGDACWVFHWARNFGQAVAHARRALDLAPDDSVARVCLFNAQVAVGDFQAAAQQVEPIARWLGLPPSFRAVLQAQSAEERVLSYWRYVGDNRDGLLTAPSQHRLQAFGQLGLRDAARTELARISASATEADLLLLRRDPLLDPIRDIVPLPPT